MDVVKKEDLVLHSTYPQAAIKKYQPAMCIETHQIMTRGIPAVIQVTGLKQKVIDLLEPWIRQTTNQLKS